MHPFFGSEKRASLQNKVKVVCEILYTQEHWILHLKGEEERESLG